MDKAIFISVIESPPFGLHYAIMKDVCYSSTIGFESNKEYNEIMFLTKGITTRIPIFRARPSMSDKDIVINNIDAGKSFNWGKTSKDYAKMVRNVLILEREQVFCIEICINMVQNGLGQIFLKIR